MAFEMSDMMMVILLTLGAGMAIPLGAAFVSNSGKATLLAVLIAVQNTPEGFNAFREIEGKNSSKRKQILFLFIGLALLGPFFGLIGHFFLEEGSAIVAKIAVFASGGILYVVFQDIAPQAKFDKKWLPSMGAVIGFVIGIIGHMMVS